jgi:hypothetical protein
VELVQRIDPTEFCLSYDTDTHLLYLRFFSGEDMGAIIAQARVTQPLDKMGPASQPMRSLKTKVDTARIEKLQALDKKYFKSKMDDALMALQDQWFEWLDGAEERAEKERLDREAEEHEELVRIADEGFEFLEETDNPLLWIATEIDWITAGERLNILYTFIAFCSQVVLKNPISVIAIGEGGSGKTHIIEAALELMPNEYTRTMKSSTMAAVYAMSEKDPYFFDGKIINMGDMGGQSDHEEAEEFKNIMKEMQTEGYVSRTKMVKGDDGEQTPKEFKLYGKPCICYTNVPGHEFDDQEMSRSIMLTPRMDNDIAVHWFKQLNRQINTPTSVNIQKHKDNLKMIPNVVHALRMRMDGVSIYNPYASFILNYLNNSKYLKRDVDKFDGILRIITAINGFKRDLFITESEHQVLFTTKDDIMIFLDLLSRYHESITKNLSPAAADLLAQLRDKAEEWDLYENGMTVNDYIFRSGTSLAKRSLQNYFSELNTMGLIKAIDKEGRSNVYALLDTGSGIDKNDICLSDMDKKVLQYNYGLITLPENMTPMYIPGSILHDANETFWNGFLPNGDI